MKKPLYAFVASCLSVVSAFAANDFVFVSPKEASPKEWMVPASFARDYVNAKEVKAVKIEVTSLGCFELFLGGKLVTDIDGRNRLDFLRPGFTHPFKRRNSYSYDLTADWAKAKDAKNTLSAFVAPSWFSDDIVGQCLKVKPAIAVKLAIEYADGTKAEVATDTEWKASFASPFTGADIYWGEHYDARLAADALAHAKGASEINTNFIGTVNHVKGAQISLRRDLALKPVQAYTWRGTEGAVSTNVFGKVKIVKKFRRGELMVLNPGETLVVDFGQNAAAIPEIEATADAGVELTFRSAEMLNDGKGELSRGNDGPGGSVYRANFRMLKDNGALVAYTFAGKERETYLPSFTFMGYRYGSLTANGRVTIRSIKSIPVTSVAKSMERGRLVTGDQSVNKLISNILWGQYSNYVSVPTDCPQRDERLGWMADTQVFTPAAFRNAEVTGFFRKFMDDVRDTQAEDGAMPSVAPFCRWAECGFNRLGWADAGVIVPAVVHRMSGDLEIIRENFDAMKKFVDLQATDKYATRDNFQYGDWLAYEQIDDDWEKLSPERLKFWHFLSGCYWLQNCRLMVEMAKAIGKDADAKHFAEMEKTARAYLVKDYFEKDGELLKIFRPMQTPALFALYLGIYDDAAAKARSVKALEENIRVHGGCLQTGFLGTSIIMDALTYGAGRPDLAYGLLTQHRNPSWLYSVDQGATTIWERWNSYTKKDGFGDVGMNSFNHYAYGAVLDWMYGTMAGIRPGPKGGFDEEFVLAPIPNSCLGFVEAEYQTKNGIIRSAWRYTEGMNCVWKFSVPMNSKAKVTFNGETKTYESGDYELKLDNR